MRKHLPLALALATLLAAPLASHAADSLNGAFFTGSLGKNAYNGDTSSVGIYNLHDQKTSYAATFGMRWNGWGWDVGYVDSGSFDFLGGSPVTAVPASLKLKGWTLGPNYKFMIHRNWWVGARAGLFRYDIDVSSLGQTGKTSGTRMYAGAGAGYDFSNGVGLGLDYNYYLAKKDGTSYDFGTLMATLELRFD